MTLRRINDIINAEFAETPALYIHELSEWPHFHWSYEILSSLLGQVRNKQGQLLGRMKALGFDYCKEASLEVLTSDVVESSQIEGEFLNPDQVRSSIARRLGLEFGSLKVDRNVEGVVEMVLDATQNYQQALGNDRLYAWHSALFPSGYSGLRKIKVGVYRDQTVDPMEVVSGPVGREKIHFVAPKGARVKRDMADFLEWFESGPDMDPVLKAGVAHLWFVTIHPFEDGNGRIARAIADMALTRSEKTSQRFYSMSAQIREEQNNYYYLLEQTQKSSLDITSWLRWFLECLERAIDAAQATVNTTIQRGLFWQSVAEVNLNDRQRKVLNLLLDKFEGNLTSSKWARLTKCSSDTALRDISHLMEVGILAKNPAAGRSVSYSLCLPNHP